MRPYDFADIEIFADREADLEQLYAELAAEEDDGADEELPPIIQDEVPEWDFWEGAA